MLPSCAALRFRSKDKKSLTSATSRRQKSRQQSKSDQAFEEGGYEVESLQSIAVGELQPYPIRGSMTRSRRPLGRSAYD